MQTLTLSMLSEVYSTALKAAVGEGHEAVGP